MAFRGAVAVTITLLVLSMQSVFVLGRLECEKLPLEFCAFSVSSSGARCVLEKKQSLAEGSVLYHCKSSAIMAQKTMEWIESEKCLQICGLQRMSVNMSTEDLNEYSHNSYKLCSDKCQTSCPNVADLYLTLAANQGLYLPHLCEVHKKRNSRMILQSENGKGDVDNENEIVPVFAPAPMMLNAFTPSPTMNAPVAGPAPANGNEKDIDNEDVPVSAPAPMTINAPTPTPTINAPILGLGPGLGPAPTNGFNEKDLDNDDVPVSAPAPMILNALTPAPTMTAAVPGLTLAPSMGKY